MLEIKEQLHKISFRIIFKPHLLNFAEIAPLVPWLQMPDLLLPHLETLQQLHFIFELELESLKNPTSEVDGFRVTVCHEVETFILKELGEKIAKIARVHIKHPFDAD